MDKKLLNIHASESSAQRFTFSFPFGSVSTWAIKQSESYHGHTDHDERLLRYIDPYKPIIPRRSLSTLINNPTIGNLFFLKLPISSKTVNASASKYIISYLVCA